MRTPGIRSLGERAAELAKRASGPKRRRKGAEPEPEPEPEPPRGKESGLWRRIERLGGIAPVMGEPSMHPANEPWEVSMMAGWGAPGGDGRGHDALQGVGEMALGEVDATRELEAPSATEGGPLELADGESCFDDRHGTGVMNTRLEEEDDLRGWCTHL